MKKTIYLLVFVSLFFTACNNDKKHSTANDIQSEDVKKDDHHDSSSHDHSSKETNERSIKSTTQKSAMTSEIIDGYVQLKNALVDDDSKKAADAGKVILNAFSNFEMAKLTEEQHKEYMEIAEDAKEHVEHIIKSPIDHQREHFEVLSNDINDLITLVGTDKHLYQDFCPMYNDGKGAIWLSETKEIKNPFYGSKMLSCGKVQKEIK